MLNSNQLDPAVGVKVVDLLKQDGRQYYNIYMYVLKQHYKSVIFDQKDWYLVEDKLSFNKNFIEWYAEDIQKAFNEQMKNSDSLLKIKKQLKHVENIQNIRYSILKRNGTLPANHVQFSYVQNPLFQYDRFDCSQLIIAEIQSKQQKKQLMKENKNYIRFQQYGIKQSDIVWIDKIDQSFFQMKDNLLSSSHVGFDTEFRCISTKYQQQGVSIIQLSTHKHHFIIDFLKLQKQNQFFDFFVQFLTNQNVYKIGHTLSSDMKYLKYTFHIPQQKGIKSFIDIANQFKSVNPGEKFSSLAFLCQRYLIKSLAKYQQRSNWNRRPLKKAQIHYAALDAYTCLLIYQKIEKQKSAIIQQHIKHGRRSHQFKLPHHTQKKDQTLKEAFNKKSIKQEESEVVFYDEQQQNQQAQIQKQIQLSEEFYLHGDTYRSNTFIYKKKFEQMLKENKQPKFLVDNMLKKLSSIMRNCGLDAQYISIRDYSLASELAEKENRIILTRDLKFFQRKQHKVPIYLIKERGDCDKMFDEVVAYFKIDLGNFQTLSRCVKCNGPELIVITREQAIKQIQFKYEDSPIYQFWRCTKCKQIYWQGGQFKNAKQKYGKLKNEKP